MSGGADRACHASARHALFHVNIITNVDSNQRNSNVGTAHAFTQRTGSAQKSFATSVLTIQYRVQNTCMHVWKPLSYPMVDSEVCICLESSRRMGNFLCVITDFVKFLGFVK